MKVLIANEEQYKALNGFNNDCFILKFIKDKQGRWVVGANVLTNDKFYEIWHDLSQLEITDYIPNDDE